MGSKCFGPPPLPQIEPAILPPISKSENKEINKQLENYICKIHCAGDQFGTGFFCNILYRNNSNSNDLQLLPVLITNNHVLNKNDTQKNKEISLSFNENKISKKLIITPDRRTYNNEKYDVSIIEIFPDKDDIHHFLNLNENILNDKGDEYDKKTIYILQYPNPGLSSFSLL